jgi:hypothetical protein
MILRVSFIQSYELPEESGHEFAHEYYNTLVQCHIYMYIYTRVCV